MGTLGATETHNECRIRATRLSSESRPRADPGPASGRMSPAPGRRPRPGLTHTRAYFTHVTRVADEILRARGCIGPHAAVLAVAAPPPMLAYAAAAALLAPGVPPPVLADGDAAAAALLAPCTWCAAGRAYSCRGRRSPCTGCAAARARTACVASAAVLADGGAGPARADGSGLPDHLIT